MNASNKKVAMRGDFVLFRHPGAEWTPDRLVVQITDIKIIKLWDFEAKKMGRDPEAWIHALYADEVKTYFDPYTGKSLVPSGMMTFRAPGAPEADYDTRAIVALTNDAELNGREQQIITAWINAGGAQGATQREAEARAQTATAQREKHARMREEMNAKAAKKAARAPRRPRARPHARPTSAPAS